MSIAVVGLLLLACGKEQRPSEAFLPTATAQAPAASPTATLTVGPVSTPTPPPAATVSPMATPQAEEPLPVPRIEIKFDRFVSSGDRALIEAGIDLTVDYFIAATTAAELELNVYAFGDLDSLRSALIESPLELPYTVDSLGGLSRRIEGTAAETYPGTIFIYTGSTRWRALTSVHRVRVAAHELFHVLQMELIGPELTRAIYTTPPNQERREGPSWLIEGSADYVSWKVLEAAGLVSLDDFLGRSDPGATFDLRQIETYLGFIAAHEDGIIVPLEAIDLVSLSDLSAILRFYVALGEGSPWRTAFHRAFGQSVESFYAEFESISGP